MRFCRKFISFIFIAIFALVSAFGVSASQPSPKIVKFKVKAEKFSPQLPAAVTTPNFVRTDALVFYENGNSVLRTARLVVKETVQTRNTAESGYFRIQFAHQRELEFIYV
jgi:hypothetical protein